MPRRIVCLGCVLMGLLAAGRPALAERPAEPAGRPEVVAQSKWQFSGDEGATWSPRPPTVPAGKVGTIQARATFQVPDPGAAEFWQLTHALPPRMDMTFSLNDKEVPVPLPGMYYKTIPAIPARLLRKGPNVLMARIRIDNRPPASDRQKVMPDFTFPSPSDPPALAGQKLRFQTGPILGAFGEDYFSATCRTNIPVPVRLTVTPAQRATPPRAASSRAIELSSPAGLIHRFRVPRDSSLRVFEYQLKATFGRDSAATAAHSVALPILGPKGSRQDELRFVIMGDSRSNTGDWATVAQAVLNEKPALVVFTGDMNDHGTDDWEWDEHYLGPEPARELLATVPFYPVKGNHEENAPLYNQLFYTPSPDGTAENWAQEIGPVLLIGINGQWSARWPQTRTWIENTLSESTAKFIFFMSHYPAWSSAGNGKLDAKTGLPRHWAYLTARTDIVPMLVRHKATALVAAHEHHYERSDLPGGLMQIISAGAGAPLSGKSRDAAKQNPYSKVFVKTLNYCLLEVKGNRCTLQAKTPAGTVIETLTWQARKLH
jgi:hypothetical protein